MSDAMLPWLDEREFYELMQTYRHINQRIYNGEQHTVDAFEAVKAYIRDHALSQQAGDGCMEERLRATGKELADDAFQNTAEGGPGGDKGWSGSVDNAGGAGGIGLTLPLPPGTSITAAADAAEELSPPTNTAAGSGGQPIRETDSQESPTAERCQSAVPGAAPLTLPEEPPPWKAMDFNETDSVVSRQDYYETRAVAQKAIERLARKDAAHVANYERLIKQRDAAEAQVAALTEVYAAACIRLQALGEKTVPLTQDAAHSGKETT